MLTSTVGFVGCETDSRVFSSIDLYFLGCHWHLRFNHIYDKVQRETYHISPPMGVMDPHLGGVSWTPSQPSSGVGG